MKEFKSGDSVTFAGGKYTVALAYTDKDDSGTLRNYVTLAHNGFVVPVEALKEFSTAAVKKTAEERKTERLAHAAAIIRARLEREQKRPFRVKISKQW